MTQIKMKVENLESNKGNKVPNQFIVTTEKGSFFQSYNSVIAIIEEGQPVKLDEKFWDFSKTTSKYRNQFLGEDTKTTEAKIKNGTYILTNLN
jgi:hypothetical protein